MSFNEPDYEGRAAYGRRYRTPSAKGTKKTINALHGSYRGYSQGCRCDDCTASKARYNAECKARKVAT